MDLATKEDQTTIFAPRKVKNISREQNCLDLGGSLLSGDKVTVLAIFFGSGLDSIDSQCKPPAQDEAFTLKASETHAVLFVWLFYPKQQKITLIINIFTCPFICLPKNQILIKESAGIHGK